VVKLGHRTAPDINNNSLHNSQTLLFLALSTQLFHLSNGRVDKVCYWNSDWLLYLFGRLGSLLLVYLSIMSLIINIIIIIITHADWLTEWGMLRVRACFILARVRTPSSPVREREREIERERGRKTEREKERGRERCRICPELLFLLKSTF